MTDTNHATTLANRIHDRSVTVGIIGLGYVGLPLAMAFVEKGIRVLGFDVDPDKPAQLARGESYIKHLGSDRVAAMAGSGRFEATTDFLRLHEPDAILICVPTPLTPQRQPDMSYVEKSARQIKACLRPGQLVILESTTYPGTTDELLEGILEETGLRSGVDFFLAYSPEREDPGRRDFTTTTTPKVVGGVDPTAGDLAQALYDLIIARTVRVSTARVAEASKLTENIFRAVNIALVNELKMVYDRMGIDVWEVLDAAESKPFGFMRFNPGPGWGGHCIPLDPFYLAWKAREYGEAPKFIELAGDINVRMPHYVVQKLLLALNERGKALRGSRVLILGIAYKKDIDDPRESPAFEIIHLLLGLGAEVSYHDPHIPVAPHMRTWPHLPPMHSQRLTPETVRAADAVLIVTDHAAVDYQAVAEHAQLVVDTRGLVDPRRANTVRA
ncbi:MAG: nucleotide sugar dehydrogenase [Acidobacteriota bacterium]|nr:nucleotide sugar dehydrogenase [Acidobacteriota bacterium]NLH09837.1 nucleotide sugar dehydrogenase [Holophagae bacterium]